MYFATTLKDSCPYRAIASSLACRCSRKTPPKIVCSRRPKPTRHARILGLLVKGNSMRATCRLVDVSINTVSKLLVDVGTACAEHQDKTLRNLACKRTQCTRFVGAQSASFCTDACPSLDQNHQQPGRAKPESLDHARRNRRANCPKSALAGAALNRPLRWRGSPRHSGK